MSSRLKRFLSAITLLVAAACLLSNGAPRASAQAVPADYPPPTAQGQPAPMPVSEIVEQMMLHNKARENGLHGYESVRRYEVEYKGYSAHLDGRLVVDANFDAATGKSFRIVSQSGSKLLVDKVLKRLVQSEAEANRDQHGTDLTPANYSFRMVGTEMLGDRPSYVLEVEPVTSNKFLYRGKVWVDAQDLALARIEAQPAKNPSFWISSTAIRQQYTKVGGYWLPAENRSESKVRVGGTAILTIDYGAYHVTPGADAASGASSLPAR